MEGTEEGSLGKSYFSPSHGIKIVHNFVINVRMHRDHKFSLIELTFATPILYMCQCSQKANQHLVTWHVWTSQKAKHLFN